MKNVILLLFLFNAYAAASQKPLVTSNKAAIQTVLDQQVKAWNEGNIDEFMKGYLNSDSIYFIGSKITLGWSATLDRYKKSYPTKAAMGQLRFEIVKMDFVSPNACLVTGHYFLTREKDSPSGIFTLLFRKVKGSWLIVYDHTS